MKRCQECNDYKACMVSVLTQRPTFCESQEDFKLTPTEELILDYIRSRKIAQATEIRDALEINSYVWNTASATLRKTGMIRYRYIAGGKGYMIA